MYERPKFTEQSELEQHLQQLAISAQKSPVGSHERRYFLNALIKSLMSSGKLYRPSLIKADHGAYQDALQNVFLYIVQNIDRYEPAKANFLAWINAHLRFRFLDRISESLLESRSSSRRPLILKDDFDVDVDEIVSPSTTSLSDELRDFLETDPTGLLRNTYLAAHPSVNFQTIVLFRIEGKSWREISAITNIPIPTLSSFYQRSLQELAPFIRKALID
jgi:DNA-directed RNA polymerase specialized sigma24 family protein